MPDFTINVVGESWYWEHWGMMGSESYRNHVETKREWCQRHFPGRLLETEESGELSAEADQIVRELLS